MNEQNQQKINLDKTYEAQPWAELKLFAKQTKVFPKRVRGKYRTLKWVWLWLLLGIYYGTPWLRWDRGPGAPDQGVLLDVPGRMFYFFGLEIWPQDVFLLTGVLFIAAIGLFFVTSLFGRVWCAWACPQTVWTDLFMIVERRIEGDRNARIKLDRAPWGFSKIGKKISKHLIWILIAMATGGAWVFYFTDAPTLMSDIFSLSVPGVPLFWILFLTFTTYLLAGHAREQVCVYMCPYSRFQSVMLDRESQIITYKEDRGEPRGKHKKGQSWEGRGDCIDCTQCISVCPTGIDIRQGVQIACINCGLCADACDRVMDLVGRPRGLIGLDSAANMERRKQGRPEKFNLLRPRTLVYSAVLLMAGSALLYALLTRDMIEMSVLPDRNPPFVQLSGGEVRNTYTVHIVNKYHQTKNYKISLGGLDNARLWRAGSRAETRQGALSVSLNSDQVGSYRFFVAAKPDQLLAERTPINFVLTDPENGETLKVETVFIGPGD